MPTIIEPEADVSDLAFGIVVSRYNESITSKLLAGAVSTLTDHGVPEQQISVVWVPGAWEIPLLATRLADTNAAVLCLGAVIRGETTHDQYINQQVSHSLGHIALTKGKPILFGLLTCNTLDQAIHRSGGNAGNKGIECAAAAIEMAGLMKKLPSTK